MQNRKIKFTFSAVIVLFCILLATGSFFIFNKSSNQNDGYQYVIGMSQANLYEPWRIAMNTDIKKEAEKYNNIKIVYRDAGGDTQKQSSDIKQLLKSGIDLLIVSMDDSQKPSPDVRQAYKSVPVIVLDRDAAGSDYTLSIGNDNEKVGMQAGTMISNLLGDKKGNVIEIQGDIDSSTTTARSKGIKEALNTHRNINIYRTLICNWQMDEAEEDVAQVLKEDNDGKDKIDVIFAYSDYMALGAYNAVKNLGLSGIKIIGVDGLDTQNGGISLVKNGTLQGTITCATGGKEAVDYSVKILNKETNIPKIVVLNSDAITKSNIDSYLSKTASK